MNYRHGFHAGGFADVVKHVILIALLNKMKQKPTAFCYLDTHAGCGYYDLFSEFAGKSKEYVGGIEKIMQAEDPPALIKQYLYCVHQLNNKLSQSRFSSLRYYPGSPMIAQSLLRPYDSLVLCELHPQEYQSLRAAFTANKQAAVHHADGFLGLKAFLPPPERRGVILIDPPYENPDEFARIARAMPLALKRFETGVFAIWYPIKEKIQVDRFLRALTQQVTFPMIDIELTIYPDLPNYLNGCGMVIINPPWQFSQTLKTLLPWLWNALTINKQGGYAANLLKSV